MDGNSSSTNPAMHPHPQAGTIGWAYLMSKRSQFAIGRQSPETKGPIVKRKLSRLYSFHMVQGDVKITS